MENLNTQPEITVKQKRAFAAVGILAFGELLLFAPYIYDIMTINCAPCLQEGPCPPCQTDYMGTFWWYLVAWNILCISLIILLKRKSVI